MSKLMNYINLLASGFFSNIALVDKLQCVNDFSRNTGDDYKYLIIIKGAII